MKRLPAAVIPAFGAVLGVPILVAPGSATAQVAYLVAFGLIQVPAWLSVRAARGKARLAHALMAGGLSIWLAGDVLYLVLEKVFVDLGPVSAADVLWVAGYPFLVGGLVAMVRSRAPGQMREAALDVLAMTTVVAVLFWQVVIAPQLSGGHTPLEAAFIVFYPLGDVLLFAAGALLAFAPGAQSGPTRYLLWALVAWFAGDVTISGVSLLRPEFDTGRLDAVLLLANCLIVAALWHRHAARLCQPIPPRARRLHPARVVFLGVALLALPMMSEAHLSRTPVNRIVMLSAMVVLTVVVLIRFTLIVRSQERAREALAHQAAHDQLTGLVNRQELHLRLTDALENGSDRPIVHFLDLDGFKAVNDVYGHAAGDAVLVEVARRLREMLRRQDTVARLGGDEFVVLTCASDDPAAITERLRCLIEEPVVFDGHDLKVGVSIGVVAAADLHEPTSDSLLAAADTGMYREKGARARREPAPLL